MAGEVRRSRVKQVPLSEVKHDLPRYLRETEKQEIIVTHHGKPAAVLRLEADEDAWFDYLLENGPRFLKRIAKARSDRSWLVAK